MTFQKDRIESRSRYDPTEWTQRPCGLSTPWGKSPCKTVPQIQEKRIRDRRKGDAWRTSYILWVSHRRCGSEVLDLVSVWIRRSKSPRKETPKRTGARNIKDRILCESWFRLVWVSLLTILGKKGRWHQVVDSGYLGFWETRKTYGKYSFILTSTFLFNRPCSRSKSLVINKSNVHLGSSNPSSLH